jgi:GT2 family glycosyltransferase
MAAFYDATPDIGALGPKLLYEDESLQHAGLFFHRPAGARLWSNMHYFKGLHRSLPAANVTREVPAVTGACLMIATALYQRVGGLHGAFIQGDFEDSDLCLRLHEAGYSCWYLSEAELYHLEGQSYPVPLRQLTTRYNAWLHTELWNDAIVQLMARFPS